MKTLLVAASAIFISFIVGFTTGTTDTLTIGASTLDEQISFSFSEYE